MLRRTLLPLAALVVVFAAGCGSPGSAAPVTSPDAADDGGAPAAPAAGMCPEGTTDCVDTPGLEGDPVPLDETGIAQRRRDAEAILGMPVEELGDTVRVGRRGDEDLPLTEDYVIGRITVETDPDQDGVQRVTSATVELPDGPETFGGEG